MYNGKRMRREVNIMTKISEDNPCGLALCNHCGNCENEFDFGNEDEGDVYDLSPPDVTDVVIG